MAIRPTTSKLLISLLFSLFSWSQLKADQYEGVPLFANEQISYSMLRQFLPYNPVIVEAGAFRGEQTRLAAQTWPQGKVYAIEPFLQALSLLEEGVSTARLTNVKTYNLALNTYNGKTKLYVCLGMHGADPAFSYASSLLPLMKDMEVFCKGPQIEVPCLTLDTWCEEEKIDHIDILRLEVEGMELKVLKSSPKILKNTQIIYVKTMIHPWRMTMTKYPDLKSFLESSGFVLLSHRFTPGIIGHAIFLSRELFDAYFKQSLGLYLDK